jgi:hypothetical protein
MEVGDAEKWASLVSSRGDGWLLIGEDATLTFHTFRLLVHEIRLHSLFTNIKLFNESFHEMLADTNKLVVLRLVQHIESSYPGTRIETLVSFIFTWVEFIQQQDYLAEFSDVTQLGIVTRKDLVASSVIDIGKIIRVHVGMRAYTPLPKGTRWSSVHNNVILGPISLLNHACRTHCNVDCDFEDNQLIVLRDVDAGDELLVEYADEEYLASRMGFNCQKCVAGKI